METTWSCSFKEMTLEGFGNWQGGPREHDIGQESVEYSYFRASQPKGPNDEVDGNEDLLRLSKLLEIFTNITKYLVT